MGNQADYTCLALTSKGNFVFFDSSPGLRMERHCIVSESQPYAPAIRARMAVILAAGKVIQLHVCSTQNLLIDGRPLTDDRLEDRLV